MQVEAVARGLQRRGAHPRRILSSPLVRARETAQTLCNVLKLPAPETSPALAPNTSPAQLRPLLKGFSVHEELLCVAHHPDVTLWVAFLTALDPSVCPLFGTSSVARIYLSEPQEKGQLEWFETSDQLSRRTP
jgi:phosphohistidine phosphatase SixA